MVFRSERNIDRAIAEFSRAIECDPTHRRSRNNLIAVLDEKGFGESDPFCILLALAQCNESIRLKVDMGEALLSKAVILRRLGNRDAAVDALRRAVDEKLEFSKNARLELISWLRSDGRVQEALEAAEAAVAKSPSPVASEHLVDILAHLGRTREAESNGLKAVGEYPTELSLRMRLASVYVDQVKLDEALLAFSEALKIRREYPVALYRKGVVLFLKGDYRASLPFLERGHRNWGAGEPDAHARHAVIERCKELLALEARLSAVLAGKDKPSSPSEAVSFAEICLRQSRTVAAARLCRDALEVAPGLASGKWCLYIAGVAAARAGCGDGSDAGTLSAAEKAEMRAAALRHLRAELAELDKQQAKGTAEAKEGVRIKLTQFLTAEWLAGVRDAGRNVLGDDERNEWEHFWCDVRSRRFALGLEW